MAIQVLNLLFQGGTMPGSKLGVKEKEATIMLARFHLGYDSGSSDVYRSPETENGNGGEQQQKAVPLLIPKKLVTCSRSFGSCNPLIL